MWRKVVVVGLTSWVAWAGDGKAGQQRLSALVLPMDEGVETLTLKIENYANESLREYASFKVRTSDELFGLPNDKEGEASLQRAKLGLDESKESFAGKAYAEAEPKIRATIKELTKAAPVIRSPKPLCEALAMYGAVLQARGDNEEAKLQVLDLVSLCPVYEVDTKIFPPEFKAFRDLVASGRTAQFRGSVTVRTKPAGARVYLNGDFAGFTPMTLQTLPIGKALVRLERPGFFSSGALVDVTGDDSELVRSLVPTQAFASYDELSDKLASEVMRDRGGAAMVRTAGSLRIDRAVVAVLKEVPGTTNTDIHLSYVDLKSGRRLAMRKAVVQGDEFGQLKGEIGRMVNALVNSASSPSERIISSDPLDKRSGSEEWNAEDRGGKSTAKEKKRSGKDPLDGVDGTEGW
jgi:hypothetical protein